MHVHVSALSAIAIFLQVVVVGFLWRTLAMKLADSPVGQAMAIIY